MKASSQLCPGEDLPTSRPLFAEKNPQRDVAVPGIPSLLRLQRKRDARGQSFGSPDDMKSLMKELRGYILLPPPPPLFPIFLALHLHSAFKFDGYYLLSQMCFSPSCLAWRQAAFLKQGIGSQLPRGSKQQPGEAAHLEGMLFICKHVIFSEKGEGNRYHTDGALPSLRYRLRKQTS